VFILKGKGSTYSTAEHKLAELIPVLGSQPAGEVNQTGSRLPLLFARPTLILIRGLLPICLLGEQRHDGCEQFALDCYPTVSWLRFER